ncbi:MAG: zinc-dependent peptidase [Deltaproteobacteria bacterium]|nr:zinc-dependent peptidase [Deltaproteobacteria bacterium]
MKLVRRREVRNAAMLSLAVSPVASGAAWIFSQHNARVTSLATLAISALVFAVLSRRWITRWALLRAPVDPEVLAILQREVTFYRELSAEDQREFVRNVRCFLHEHSITGARREAVSLTTRVLVAASASMLLFAREDLDLPTRIDVVVYAEAFDLDYQVSRGGEVLGLAHAQGPVVLSERALREGFARARDGLHVGVHEFAHMLDLEGAHFDGIPVGLDGAAARSWAGLVHREMQRIDRGRSILRAYGATSEQEFFAVATEAFFERPVALREKHPEVYETLKRFYGQDPAHKSKTTDPATSPG